MSCKGWETYRLGDLGSFFGGVTSIKPHDYGFGTPFLTYKNIFKNSKVNIDELELMNVRPQDVEKRSAIYGDIFFTASSETPDEVAMSSVLLDNVPNLTYNGFSKRYRLNDFETLLPVFARYLFRSRLFREAVCQVATGDIRFNISQESLSNITVHLPSIAEQKRISRILFALDDKIELNSRINDNLEQQAQAIFKSWFVDFELRDLNGDTINASLETLIDFDPNNKVVKNEQYAFYDMKCLSASNMCLGTGTRRLPGSSSSFRNNDTLLAKITPCLENGKTGFVFGLSEDEVACGSTEFIVMRSKGVVSPYWIYCLARDDKFRDTAIKSMIGSSGRQRVQSQVLKQYEMGFSQSAMCNFHTTTEPIFNTIATNHKESFTLIRLRDALQPKLMSGELSVEEAERKL